MNPTQQLCEAIEAMKFEDLPSDVIDEAKLCLLDWLGVTVGGAHEQLTTILIDLAGDLGGEKQASIIGHSRKDSVLNAALIKYGVICGVRSSQGAGMRGGCPGSFG